MSIAYSDGRDIETRILELVRKASDLRSSTAIAREEYGEWAVRYHLTPERANLVRHLDFSGLDVLELGAGMGGVSRYLAENAKTLTIVEGTEARFAVLKERLRDLTNWVGQVANLQDAKLDRKFDVVCVIGVLEYAELYIQAKDGKSPFELFLETVAGHLKPGGSLVLAIENAIGLKYWAGSAEDHTGRLFDGLCGYPGGKSPKTFSGAQLKALLRDRGLDEIDEYFPFPDYKVPSSVLTREMLEAYPAISADIASTQGYAPYGPPKWALFPEPLAVHQLAHAGILGELSNSFLFVARKSGEEGRLARKQGIAWHYSAQRKEPTRTVFLRDGSRTRVRKEALDGSKVLFEEPLATGKPLREVLLRHAYFDEWPAFENTLADFLGWSLSKWRRDRGYLDPAALDATFPNAFVSPKGAQTPYSLFDLEWTADEAMPESWFVFRNIMVLARDRVWFGRAAPFQSLGELYDRLCSRLQIPADPVADLEREARFQVRASATVGALPHHEALREILETQLNSLPSLPRSPADETWARTEITKLRNEIEAQKARQNQFKPILDLFRQIPGARLALQATRKALRR